MRSSPNIDKVLASPFYRSHGRSSKLLGFYVIVSRVPVAPGDRLNNPGLIAYGQTWEEAFTGALANLMTLRITQ